MKYKPCCNTRCLLGTCEIRDQGGCYCLCLLFDHLSSLKSVEEGHTIVKGAMIYFPDKNDALNYLNSLSENEQKQYERFVKNIPATRQEIENIIKEFELKDEK